MSQVTKAQLARMKKDAKTGKFASGAKMTADELRRLKVRITKAEKKMNEVKEENKNPMNFDDEVGKTEKSSFSMKDYVDAEQPEDEDEDEAPEIIDDNHKTNDAKSTPKELKAETLMSLKSILEAARKCRR